MEYDDKHLDQLPAFGTGVVNCTLPTSLQQIAKVCFRLTLDEVSGSIFCNSEPRESLWNEAKPYLEDLLREPGVQAVYIHGSFVSSKNIPNDLDVVFFHSCVNESVFMKRHLIGGRWKQGIRSLQLSTFSHLKGKGLDLHGSPADGGGGVDCRHCNVNHSWRECLECQVMNCDGLVIHLMPSQGRMDCGAKTVQAAPLPPL